MNLYLDTSALVPLIVREASSALCRRLWDDADTVLCTAVGHVEATAALARATRSGRLGPADQVMALEVLDGLWSDVTVIAADTERLRSASEAALRHGLRGFDAVHCAAALSVVGDGLVAASGDRELLGAWRADGLAVVDTASR